MGDFEGSGENKEGMCAEERRSVFRELVSTGSGGSHADRMVQSGYRSCRGPRCLVSMGAYGTRHTQEQTTSPFFIVFSHNGNTT
jgi:hypothetical protein